MLYSSLRTPSVNELPVQPLSGNKPLSSVLVDLCVFLLIRASASSLQQSCSAFGKVQHCPSMQVFLLISGKSSAWTAWTDRNVNPDTNYFRHWTVHWQKLRFGLPQSSWTPISRAGHELFCPPATVENYALIGFIWIKRTINLKNQIYNTLKCKWVL